jgi:hypothetical protein
MSTDDHLLKLLRAHEHLDALFAEIAWWSQSQPYRILSERDAESGLTILIAEPLGQAPLKLSVIAGDVVLNLRSCLDLLALALAESNHNGRLPEASEKKSQFPICDTETLFESACKRGRVEFVADDPSAVIQRLQPYHRGDEQAARHDPLAILRDLSDFDKHRRLPLMAAFHQVVTADVLAEEWSVKELSLSFGGPLEARTEVARYRGLAAATGEEVEMDIRLSVNVAFAGACPEAAAGRPLYPLLEEVWRYVAEEVIPQLKPYLRGAPAA